MTKIQDRNLEGNLLKRYFKMLERREKKPNMKPKSIKKIY